MTMVRTVCLALFAIVGCAAPGAYVGAPEAAPPEVRRAPVVVTARVVSALPDPYYVLSGPTETYRAYRVAERFEALLDAYVAAKTGAGHPPVEVEVTLDDLSTGYRQIGGVSRDSGRRAAKGTGVGGVRLAAAGRLARGGFLGRFSDLDLDRGDGNIPYEITKRATLTATVAVSTAGRHLARETVRAEAEEVVRWEDYEPWRAYDYDAVFGAAFQGVIAEVDRVVDAALASLGR